MWVMFCICMSFRFKKTSVECWQLVENKNNQSVAAAPTQYVLGAITGKEPNLQSSSKRLKSNSDSRMSGYSYGRFCFFPSEAWDTTRCIHSSYCKSIMSDYITSESLKNQISCTASTYRDCSFPAKLLRVGCNHPTTLMCKSEGSRQ